MKVLFISLGWPKGRLWGELGFRFPSLSLAAIAAVTPPEWDVALCDDHSEQIDFDTDADLIALTAMTPQAPRAYEIAATFRNRGKSVVMRAFTPATCRTRRLPMWMPLSKVRGKPSGRVCWPIFQLVACSASTNRMR